MKDQFKAIFSSELIAHGTLRKRKFIRYTFYREIVRSKKTMKQGSQNFLGEKIVNRSQTGLKIKNGEENCGKMTILQKIPRNFTEILNKFRRDFEEIS